MFKVDSISFPDLEIKMDFENITSNQSNLLTVLTGPNGSGKTEVLYRLASIFGRVGKTYDLNKNEVRATSRGHSFRVQKYRTLFEPSVVITQTFSPFSRFPQLPRSEKSRKHSYTPIGLYRGKNWSSQAIAKDILIQSLAALLVTPEKANIYSDTLSYLGYSSEVEVEFSTPLTPIFFAGLNIKNVENRLFNYLEHLDNSRNNFSQQKILRELRKEGNILPTVLDDLVILRKNEFTQSSSGLMSLKINFMFNFDNLESNLPSKLNSLIRLKEVGLFRLNSCEIQSLTTRTKKIDLSEASSGEQQIISSIFGILSAIKSNSLVLIDEPEISLHPKWQLKFIDLLTNALKGFDGCHVIISTHSPLIVQSAQTLGHQVISLEPDGDDHVDITTDQDSSVEKALVEVFETPVPRSAYISNRILEIISSVEESDTKQLAIYELQRYLKIYSSRNIESGDKTHKLLEDAISLVEEEHFDE